MTAPATSLNAMRRSILGAWLAVAYGLAVLAAALAPAPAAAALIGDGTPLCSGMTVAEDGKPFAADERLHCKGCPLQAIHAAPESPRPVEPEFAYDQADLAPLSPVGLASGMPDGLAQPRAPPVRAVVATTAS